MGSARTQMALGAVLEDLLYSAYALCVCVQPHPCFHKSKIGFHHTNFTTRADGGPLADKYCT